MAAESEKPRLVVNVLADQAWRTANPTVAQVVAFLFVNRRELPELERRAAADRGDELAQLVLSCCRATIGIYLDWLHELLSGPSRQPERPQRPQRQSDPKPVEPLDRLQPRLAAAP